MKNHLSLFSAVGIEIEYMLVNPDTLTIEPKSSDILTRLAGGNIANEIEFGDIAVSNELVSHVIELKMNGPAPLAAELDNQFHNCLTKNLRPTLDGANLTLLPSGAHPWLSPNDAAIKLWPHGDKKIYQAYDRIFGCHGHGFSNLQSVHINLPFANDEEFYRLHSAIRLVLPLIPAFCASTPFIEGKFHGMVDNRLKFYKTNQQKISIITGDVVPEFITSIEDYKENILNKIYSALAPDDPEGILQHEWVNSRGAIARFDRFAIEIRVMDSQESPLADIALAAFFNGILQYIINDTDIYLEKPCPTNHLKALLDKSIISGSKTICDDKLILEQFNIQKAKLNLHQLGETLLEKAERYILKQHVATLQEIINNQTLAERMLNAAGTEPGRASLLSLYQDLKQCLWHNELYLL